VLIIPSEKCNHGKWFTPELKLVSKPDLKPQWIIEWDCYCVLSPVEVPICHHCETTSGWVYKELDGKTFAFPCPVCKASPIYDYQAMPKASES
jgi:hypothetical protein